MIQALIEALAAEAEVAQRMAYEEGDKLKREYLEGYAQALRTVARYLGTITSEQFIRDSITARRL